MGVVMKKQLFFVLLMELLCFSFTAVQAQKMTVKDSDENVLMEVNDEGTIGSISLPVTSTALSIETNKLYNLNGSLIWNGDPLGTAGSAGGWTDDGTVVRLSNSSDMVGIGIASPALALDVKDSLGINGTRLLYLPDQTDFEGTLIVGDGGSSLDLSEIHSFGGKRNTAIGIGAFKKNTTGYQNTTIGTYTLWANTTGSNNTANGYEALNRNTTGSQNTACGGGALYFNTLGSYNTAYGTSAMWSNTEGNYNIGIGYGANYFNQTGSNNTIIGSGAGKGTTEHDKSGNIFIGYEAGYYETGDNKLYIENSNSSTPLIGGDFSANEVYLNGTVGIGNTTPSYKLDVGGSIGLTGSININNTQIVKLYDSTSILISNASPSSGTNNTIIGMDNYSSGGSGIRGSGNIAIGTGVLSTGGWRDSVTAIGYNADITVSDVVNSTVIGAGAQVSTSNKVVIGNGSVTSIGGYAAWTNYSDKRLKENIEYRDNLGLNFILKLKTASFNYKDDKNKRRRDGLIAQDVEAVLEELGVEFSGLVVDDDEKQTMNLSYGKFVLPLINAIKEQQQTISSLEVRLEKLESIINEQ